MGEQYRATPQELEAQIQMCPAEVMPKMLLAVIGQCIKLKVFQDKPIHKVVETLENNLKGFR